MMVEEAKSVLAAGILKKPEGLSLKLDWMKGMMGALKAEDETSEEDNEVKSAREEIRSARSARA